MKTIKIIATTIIEIKEILVQTIIEILRDLTTTKTKQINVSLWEETIWCFLFYIIKILKNITMAPTPLAIRVVFIFLYLIAVGNNS